MSAFRLTLFGGVALYEKNEREAQERLLIDKFSRRRGPRLLAWLALGSQSERSRLAAAQILWPDTAIKVTSDRLRNELSVLLGDLHRAHPQLADTLVITKTTLRLDRAAVVADSDLFDAARRAALLLRDSGQSAVNEKNALHIMERGIALYDTGVFLPNYEEEWAASERLRLATEFPNIAICAAHLYRRAGRNEEAQRIAERLLRDDATHAEARQIVQGKIALSSPQATQTEDAAFITPPPSPPPRQEGRLWGREFEVARVEALLFPGLPSGDSDSENSAPKDRAFPRRWVTLSGMGGVGKTHLASEITRRARASGGFVCFVSLQACAAAAHVPEVVAQALRLTHAPVSPENIAAVLRAQALRSLAGAPPPLLILDNLEHLLNEGGDEVAWFAENLLNAVKDLRLLATSRYPLMRRSEETIPILPLALPPDVPRAEAGALNNRELNALLTQQPAVALFCERARCAQPGFALNARNVTAVIGLCQRLEGIPLALELAAARVGTFTPAQIAKRLEDRFTFLALVGPAARSGDAVAPHHRALVLTLEWTYNLLTPQTQRLLACLGVFQGGFTVNAASFICGDAICVGEEEPDILDETTAALEELARWSLITREAARNGADGANDGQDDASSGDDEEEVRFQLLDTVRDFSQRYLERQGSGLKESLRRRYGEYYRNRAGRDHESAEKDDLRWHRQVARDYDNIMAALNLYEQGDDAFSFLHFAASLALFWRRTGRTAPGWRLLQSALARTESGAASGKENREETALRLLGLSEASVFAMHLCEWERGLYYAQNGLRIAHDFGIEISIALFERHLGYHALSVGQQSEARTFLNAALERMRHAGDEKQEGRTLHTLASVAIKEGAPLEACALYRQSLNCAHRVGDPMRVSTTLNALATVLMNLSQYAEAERLAAESRRVSAATGDMLGVLRATMTLALLAGMTDPHRDALRLCNEGVALAQAYGGPLEEGMMMQFRADVQRSRREYDAARRDYAQSLTLLHASEHPTQIATGLTKAAVCGAECAKAEEESADAVLRASARWRGTADRLMRECGARWHTIMQSLADQADQAARRSLAADDYENARAEGSAWTLDAVVTDVLLVFAPDLLASGGPPKAN